MDYRQEKRKGVYIAAFPAKHFKSFEVKGDQSKGHWQAGAQRRN